MPLTTLDPNTALIVIDLQKGLVNGSFIHPIGEVFDVFRAKNLPLALVNVAGLAPGRTDRVRAAAYRFRRGGPIFCRSWINNRATSSSRSEAGARSQRRILNASSGARRYPGCCDRSGDIGWR
jgi:nicotinamidase-related amidase